MSFKVTHVPILPPSRHLVVVLSQGTLGPGAPDVLLHSAVPEGRV